MGEFEGKVSDIWSNLEWKIRGLRIDKNINDISCVQTLHEYILPLTKISKSNANLWATTLAQVLEKVCSTPDKWGDERLWVGE